MGLRHAERPGNRSYRVSCSRKSNIKLCLWAVNQAFLISGSEEGERGGFTIRNAHRKEAADVLENEHSGGETEQGSGSDHDVRTCC